MVRWRNVSYKVGTVSRAIFVLERVNNMRNFEEDTSRAPVFALTFACHWFYSTVFVFSPDWLVKMHSNELSLFSRTSCITNSLPGEYSRMSIRA